jgi:hypothetical protein
MADIWDYFKGLFKKAENSSPTQPLLHEMIQRSAEEKEDYEFWKNTLVCQRMLNWLHEQYLIFRVEPDNIDEAIDFLDTPSSKGVVVYFFKTQYSLRDVTHFFDHLKEQVLQLNYRTQISDLRSYERNDWVETVQRHYLKPRPAQNDQGQSEQQYGNIMIELTLRNDQIFNLKFRATTYRDHKFAVAQDFVQLMQSVLSK